MALYFFLCFVMKTRVSGRMSCDYCVRPKFGIGYGIGAKMEKNTYLDGSCIFHYISEGIPSVVHIGLMHIFARRKKKCVGPLKKDRDFISKI